MSREIPTNFSDVVDALIRGHQNGVRDVISRFRFPTPSKPINGDDRRDQFTCTSLLEKKTKSGWEELKLEFGDEKNAMLQAGQLLRTAQERALVPKEIETLRRIETYLLCCGYTRASFRTELGFQMMKMYVNILRRYTNGETQQSYPVTLSEEQQATRDAEAYARYKAQVEEEVTAQQGAELASYFRTYALEEKGLIEQHSSDKPIFLCLDGKTRLSFKDLESAFKDVKNCLIEVKMSLYWARKRSLNSSEIERLQMAWAYLKAEGYDQDSFPSALGEADYIQIQDILKKNSHSKNNLVFSHSSQASK